MSQRWPANGVRSASWQHPFVDVFQHVGAGKTHGNCVKMGDVKSHIDKARSHFPSKV